MHNCNSAESEVLGVCYQVDIEIGTGALYSYGEDSSLMPRTLPKLLKIPSPRAESKRVFWRNGHQRPI